MSSSAKSSPAFLRLCKSLLKSILLAGALIPGQTIFIPVSDMKKKTKIEEKKVKESWQGWYWTGHCAFYGILYEDEDKEIIDHGHGPFPDFQSCQADALVHYTAEKAKIEQSLRKIKLSQPE